ncbi:MAG: response regulator, partial [Planctomycetota bacterium]
RSEDVFVAMQQGRLDVTGRVEPMLAAVDFLARLAKLTADSAGEWMSTYDDEAERLVVGVRALASSGGSTVPRPQAAPKGSAAAADDPMLELFRVEVENQLETLSNGLIDLEKGSARADLLETLMRAAHSIKGAARLVDLEPAVALAHVLEDVFSGFQLGAIKPEHDLIDVMLRGLDFFSHIAGVDSSDLGLWVDQHKDDAQQAAAAIREAAGQGAPPVGVHEMQATIDVPGTTLAITNGDAADGAADDEFAVDHSMFDLARGELQANVEVLSNVRDVESLRGSAFEPLVRAMHSMKGTVRILGVEPMVQPATALEEQLRRVHEGRQPMTPALRDCLKSMTRLFDNFRRLEAREVPAWVRTHRSALADLTRAIMQPFATPAPLPVGTSSTIGHVTGGASTGLDTRDRRGGATKQSNDFGRRSIDKVRERYLRVTSEHLDKLMALSGESLVEARRMTAFNDHMLRYKQRQQELFGMVHDLLGLLGNQSNLGEKVEDSLKKSRRLLGDCRELFNDRLGDIDSFAQRQTGMADRFHREVMDSRMRPFSDGTRGFPRMVRDVARQLGKQVQLEIDGDTTLVDREILEKIEAPINHMLRNAIDHGIESPDVRQRLGKPTNGRIRLIARHSAGMLQIVVADDGRGVDLDWLRDQVASRGLTSREIAADLEEQELLEFLFLPNFSTSDTVTDISGRGVGLNVVQDTVREIGGSLRCNTTAGQGMEIEMLLPISVSVLRALLVEVGGEPYAFPLSRIERTLRVPQSEVHELEGRQYITLASGKSEQQERHVGLVPGTQVLELGRVPSTSDHLNIVILSDRQRSFGLIVDRLVGQHELVVKALDTRLGKVKDISAAALLDDGSPALIVDVEDLLRSIELLVSRARLDHVTQEQTTHHGGKRMRILVVDDSITVREVQRKLLTAAGYDVEVAVDGMDGWNAVRTHDYDMVISDIDMPRMNGIEFVRNIKNHPVLRQLPVLIVSYKDREEDRRAGLEAGADYYLTKSSFQDETLIEAVRDLIGAPA